MGDDGGRDGASGIVVASWNLQGRPPERTRIADAVRAWSADVLLLQEADGLAIGGVLPAELAATAWWPGAGTSPGVGIVSRWPFEATGFVPANGEPWDRVRVCWGRLRSPVGTLTVAAVHLQAPLAPSARPRRDAQRSELERWAADEGRGAALIVGGDFNTRDPRLPSLADASAGTAAPTWRPLAVAWMRPLLRIDAIFVSGSLRATARVADEWRGSDHCPVVARVELAGSGATLRGR